jgi:hypothetical protein
VASVLGDLDPIPTALAGTVDRSRALRHEAFVAACERFGVERRSVVERPRTHDEIALADDFG